MAGVLAERRALLLEALRSEWLDDDDRRQRLEYDLDRTVREMRDLRSAVYERLASVGEPAR